MIFYTPEGIRFFVLAARKGALEMEVRFGPRRGGPVYRVCKAEYGLTGTPAEVLEQMKALVEQAIAAKQAGDASSDTPAGGTVDKSDPAAAQRDRSGC